MNEIELKTITVPAAIEQEMEEEGRSLSLQAETFQVVDAESYKSATEFVSTFCIPFIAKVEEFFKTPISTAFYLHRDLCTKRKRALGDPTRAREIIDSKKASWELEERRKEEKRLQAEAIERARLEKIRMEEAAAIERERLAVQKAAQEAAMKAAEDAKLKAAEEAEKSGNLSARDAIIAQEVVVPVIEVPRQAGPVLPPPPPPPIQTTLPEKSAVAKAVQNWAWELVDVNLVGREYMVVSDPAVNKVVRALGPKAAEIVGGIRVYEDIRYSYKKPICK